jgi:hypothetical protein
VLAVSPEPPPQLIDLDMALQELGRLDERQSRLVDLHSSAASVTTRSPS